MTLELTTVDAVTGEMNLSETAFVVANEDGCHDLRWFTPTVEVDVCGHATLVAAHVLGRAARFHTRSGELSCVPTDDGWIEMDFPADPPHESDAPATPPIDGVVWYGIDCVSRVFAPNAGIPEDPVTGSAHCTLAEYWGERLDRTVLVGEQASARGRVVRMRREEGRVVLGGQAVTMAKVRLFV
jgi:predicted PhzF superfamily epimerase YddE/YHI9